MRALVYAIQGLDGLADVRAPATRSSTGSGWPGPAAHLGLPERVMPPLAGQRDTDPADTEATLIARAQAGDVGAFERLSGAYADRLFMLLLRLLGDRSEAEDVAQEVMLRAWRGHPPLPGPVQLLHLAVPDRGQRGQPRAGGERRRPF